MSYQVIARRWRPQNFDEVTGQSHVTTPLRNAIRTDRMPHALLLTGPRGVGKTTLARIIARCLNCEKGPTDSPCGVCTACVEIAAGNSTDVREVDAASRTGVDDVREVIEAVRYAPSPGKHRIFVIDEVHMLSTAAFNALLKTLEEPPPKSLFIFATTNPEKIPFTVLSRCQRYDLRLFSNAEVTARLAEICRSEGIEISDASLRAVAREGQGSMRDSQTLLDQLVAYGGTTVSDETVSSLLDLVDRHILHDIARACIEQDAAGALAACHRAAQSGTEPMRIASAIVSLLRDLVVLRLAPESPELVEGGEAEIEAMRSLAEQSEPARLRRMFKVLVQEQEALEMAPHPFAVLEMALVRLATLPSGDDVETLLGRLDALERQLGGGGAPGQGGGSGRPAGQRNPSDTGATRAQGVGTRSPQKATPRSAPEAAGRDPASEAPVDAALAVTETAAVASAPRATAAHPQPASNGRSANAKPAVPSPAPSPAPAAAPNGAPRSEGDVPLDTVMERLRAFAQNEDRGLFASLDEARLSERRDGFVRFTIGPAFHRKRLQDRSEDLSAACTRFFGRATQAEVVAPTSNGNGRGTGPKRADRREDERRRRQEALNHPKINIALEALQAEIVDIRPIGKGDR